MGILDRLRSKNREQEPVYSARAGRDHDLYHPSKVGAYLIQHLPEQVLSKIFSFVCPHVTDFTYETCEDSQLEDGCMLCDLRDLAHCAQTCRQWYAIAQALQFTSLRIDAVHYCALEETLQERRRKGGSHFRNKSATKAVDIPGLRLSLLCRTLLENPQLAARSRILKLPFMTRETGKADLARAVTVLPLLEYVDLPDGFFSGDASCAALRQGLQSNCPRIKKMSYKTGSEQHFQLLTQSHARELPILAQRYWEKLQILVVDGLAVEYSLLRMAFSNLPELRDITLMNMTQIDDSIFGIGPGQLPTFPAVHTLRLIDLPNLTAKGFILWLAQTLAGSYLHTLFLHDTAIGALDLSSILQSAVVLQELAITEQVSKSMEPAGAQGSLLASQSLKTLRFEILNTEGTFSLQNPADSYYTYLVSSLQQNALPALRTLYVRDQQVPELLAMPAVLMPFADPAAFPAAPSSGLRQPLEIFSKGVDEYEWVYTSFAPPTVGSRRGSLSGGRPLSVYSASRGLGPQWAEGGFGGEVRRSVVVGNGFGGYLAVPAEEVPRSQSTDGFRRQHLSPDDANEAYLPPPPNVFGELSNEQKRRSRHDIWR